MRPEPRLAAALLAVLALAGCSAPGYYLQAAGGQWELWRSARPLDAVEADAGTPAALRARFAVARRIRDFASRELGLPDNGSYRSYADLRRPYVVWNVFAAEPLSIRARQWCFPVAGCVGYRGYFAREKAEAFAAGLRAQGLDVYVAGVPAYSTLGWFDDPLLNTFIHYPDAELARLMFHELAHQVAYVRDDSAFNESYAVTVEQEGLRRWLDAQGSDAQRAAFARAQAMRADFAALVLAYRARLDAVYASQADDADKLRYKAATLAELGEEYRRIKAERWSGFTGYDRWFAQDINNATLASIGIYTELVPAFQALLADSAGELPRFHAAVRELARLPRAERRARLAAGLSTATAIPR